jgi:hypothetical protein
MKINCLSHFHHLCRRALFVLATCALTQATHGHEVWIEDTPDGKLIVRFAEYGEKFAQSPGALDALTLPFAWKPAPVAKSESPNTQPVNSAAREERDIRAGKVDAFEVQKKSDGFLLLGSSSSQAAQIETGFTVMGQPGDPQKPARKPYFYARWQPAEAGVGQPGLNFDLVPTGTPGKVCVYFRGKPLPGVKVKLYPPAEAEQELVSDATGLVQFSATKPGLYLLTAVHQRETISGFFWRKSLRAGQS